MRSQEKEAETPVTRHRHMPAVRVTSAEVNRNLMLRYGLEHRHICRKKTIVQRLLARVDIGSHTVKGQFAIISFNTDNLLY